MPAKEVAPVHNKKRTDSIDAKSLGYQEMAEKWKLMHDLLGGTRKMRAAETEWLPMEEQETRVNYIARLNRSILFGGLKSAIEQATSKPFVRPVTVKNAPEQLAFLETDADSCGQSLTQFARSVFEDLATYGVAHIFVDFPMIPENTGVDEDGNPTKATLADEAGARATFVKITPPALIGWLMGEKNSAGDDSELEQIRILEKTIEKKENAKYVDEEVVRIRVVNKLGWALFRKVEREDADDKSWVIEKAAPHSFEAVPLVTIYADKTGFMMADPPFEDVAWLNLAHWQSDSDQRNILRVSRFAILFAKGWAKQEAEQGFSIGPFNTIASSSDTADMKYVEHNGTAIEAGRKDLTDLEARMEVMGMAPFVERSSQSTATGKAIDQANNLTRAQEWVRATEAGFVEAYKMAAKWHKIELPEDFGIDIFSDFKVSATTADLDFLLRTRQAGELSRLTFLTEIKRRGQLADSVNPEEEMKQIADEEEDELQRLDPPDLDNLPSDPTDPVPPSPPVDV